MGKNFAERFSQPGEAQTRAYLARLGWVNDDDAAGPPGDEPEAEAEAHRLALSPGWRPQSPVGA